MDKYNWTRLNHLQLGRYAEYYAKMEFTLYGFDVYSAEVDDKGIDFVIRRDNKYFDIQVKSARNNNYIFFRKSKFPLKENLLAVVVLFYQGEHPKMHLFPSLEWQSPNSLFNDRDYAGKKSKPEWGLSITKSKQELLKNYLFDTVVKQL